jgi:hypothetical protein
MVGDDLPPLSMFFFLIPIEERNLPLLVGRSLEQNTAELTQVDHGFEPFLRRGMTVLGDLFQELFALGGKPETFQHLDVILNAGGAEYHSGLGRLSKERAVARAARVAAM